MNYRHFLQHQFAVGGGEEGIKKKKGIILGDKNESVDVQGQRI